MHYLEVERETLANERYVAAVGVAFAIAQCFGEKKALKKFQRMLEPHGSAATAGDSSEMARFRQRLRDVGVMEKKR